MELVKELSKTPLERSHAGDLGDSCRGSLTSNEVPMKVLKELARPLLQRIGAGSTSRCFSALILDSMARSSCQRSRNLESGVQALKASEIWRECNVLLVCSLSGAVKYEEPAVGSGGHAQDAGVLDFDEVLTETGESSGDVDGLLATNCQCNLLVWS